MEKREWGEEKGGQKRIRIETMEQALEFVGMAMIRPESIEGFGDNILQEIMLFLPVIDLEMWCSLSKRIEKLCTTKMWRVILLGDFNFDVSVSPPRDKISLKREYTRLSEIHGLMATSFIEIKNLKVRLDRSTAPYSSKDSTLRNEIDYVRTFGLGLTWTPYVQETLTIVHSLKLPEKTQILKVEVKMDPLVDFIEFPIRDDEWTFPLTQKSFLRDGTHIATIVFEVLADPKGAKWRVKHITYHGYTGRSFVTAFDPAFWENLVKHDKRRKLFITPDFESQFPDDEGNLEWNTAELSVIGKSLTKLDHAELRTISKGGDSLSFLYDASPETNDRLCEHNLPQDQFIEWLETKQDDSNLCPVCDKMEGL